MSNAAPGRQQRSSPIPRERERVFGRYVLYQIPGWVAGAALALLAWEVHWLSGKWATAAFGLWVLKDFVLYPLVRDAYRPGAEGARLLVGAEGVSLTHLDPEGRIRVRGERWRARATGRAIPPRTAVRVVGTQGNVLEVEAIPEEDFRTDPDSGSRSPSP